MVNPFLAISHWFANTESVIIIVIYLLAGWYVECAIIFIGHSTFQPPKIYIYNMCVVSEGESNINDHHHSRLINDINDINDID